MSEAEIRALLAVVTERRVSPHARRKTTTAAAKALAPNAKPKKNPLEGLM